MTVPRATKLARRRMVAADIPELDRPWVIHTLFPSVLIGALLWALLILHR